MKYVARKQLKSLFNNPFEAIEEGLWFSGYMGEGEYKEWYENGKLWVHCFYKNGKKNGEYKEWWKDENELYAHLLLKNNEVVEDYLNK